MNSVHLIGRLATDVEVKEVNGGSKVSSFILAVDRNAEEADFFRIKAWNSQAEAAGDHLGKGRRSPWRARCARTSTRRMARSARPCPWWPSGSSTCSAAVCDARGRLGRARTRAGAWAASRPDRAADSARARRPAGDDRPVIGPDDRRSVKQPKRGMGSR